MKLHVTPPSPRAFKVVAVMHHLGLDAELAFVDLAERRSHEAGVRRAQPESQDARPRGRRLRALGVERHHAVPGVEAARAGLWPTDPRQQADVSRWQCWELAHWERACGTLVFERFVKGRFGQGDPDPSEVARGERDFHEVAQVLDQYLRGRDWLVGRRHDARRLLRRSLATCAEFGRYPLGGYGEIGRWYRGLEALPAWQKSTVRRPRASAGRRGACARNRPGSGQDAAAMPSSSLPRTASATASAAACSQELLPRVQDRPAVTRREEALVREMLETSLKLLRDVDAASGI